MKILIRSKLLRKFIILACLVTGLAYVYLGTGTQPSLAAPCCSSCPGFENPGEEYDYCTNQCGASSGGCYDFCLQRVYSCYAHCVVCH